MVMIELETSDFHGVTVPQLLDFIEGYCYEPFDRHRAFSMYYIRESVDSGYIPLIVPCSEILADYHRSIYDVLQRMSAEGSYVYSDGKSVGKNQIELWEELTGKKIMVENCI